MNAVIKLPVGPAMSRARARPVEAFLAGPVPWAWLAAAGALPGKALHVALAIRYRAGRARSKRIALSLTNVASTFGFDRAQACRGLAALAEAQLVAVEHGAGRKPVVTILPGGEPADDALEGPVRPVRPNAVHNEEVPRRGANRPGRGPNLQGGTNMESRNTSCARGM